MAKPGDRTWRRARALAAHAEDLLVAAARHVPQQRVGALLKRWLHRPTVTSALAAEVGHIVALYAAEAAVFLPSGSGRTALDRLARKEEAAMGEDQRAALRLLQQSSLRLLKYARPHPGGGVYAQDLLSRQYVRYLGNHPCEIVEGVFGVRAAPFGEEGLVPTGQAVPLPEAWREGVPDQLLDSSGRRFRNAVRADEAFYAAATQELVSVLEAQKAMPPALDGGAAPPEPEEDWGCETAIAGIRLEAGAPPEAFELLAMAQRWSRMPAGEEPPRDDVDVVRQLADPGFLYVLLTVRETVSAARRDAPAVLQALDHMARIQVEACLRRERMGLVEHGTVADVEEMLASDAARPDPVTQAATRRLQALKNDVLAMLHRHQPDVRSDGLQEARKRIRALHDQMMKSGCTEANVIAAAQALSDLLEDHDVSLEGPHIEDAACGARLFGTPRRRISDLDRCMLAVAEFCECRTWIAKDEKGYLRHVIFGLEWDAEAALALFSLIAQAFDAETLMFKSSAAYRTRPPQERRSATVAFQAGLARGISEKLAGIRDKRQMRTTQAAGRDVGAVKASVVNRELDKLGLTFRVFGSKKARSLDADAYRNGVARGQSSGAAEDHRRGVGSSGEHG